MSRDKTDLLQGPLDLLVLKTLQAGPAHGWDIAQRIQQVSEDVLQVNQGSLYPADRCGAKTIAGGNRDVAAVLLGGDARPTVELAPGECHAR